MRLPKSYAAACVMLLVMGGSAGAQVIAPEVPNVPIPQGVDPFNLSLDEAKKYSSAKNFELLGHSYFKIDQRTPWAKGQGRPGGEVGSGFNTVRVYDGIAYLGGYALPPTLYHVVIADVRDPKNIQTLSTIPCNPGTRCNYLRVNRAKKILIIGHDDDPRGNPTKPPEGEKSKPGWSFHDVSDPRNPKPLAFIPATPGGKTHGLDIDDRYHYGCGQFSADLNREALQIVDYGDPANIRQIATWHVPGQLKGEQYGPAQPQQSGRQAADHPVPRDRLPQRPALSRLARRRHAGARHQGPHRAEAHRHL